MICITFIQTQIKHILHGDNSFTVWLVANQLQCDQHGFFLGGTWFSLQQQRHEITGFFVDQLQLDICQVRDRLFVNLEYFVVSFDARFLGKVPRGKVLNIDTVVA